MLEFAKLAVGYRPARVSDCFGRCVWQPSQGNKTEPEGAAHRWTNDMIDKLLPHGLLTLAALSPMPPAPRKSSAGRGADPLAAYPLLQASLAEAERNGAVAAEKRRLAWASLRR
jgi:hypothetical protein